MFLLDTNVISELRRIEKADARVIAWAAAASAPSLFLSAITILEIEFGALQIARRDVAQGALLRAWVDDKILPGFDGRILPIDTAVARRCAHIQVPNRRPERDALIAATAMVHGLTIVTRNVADFERIGVGLLNPWEAQPAGRLE